MAAVSLEWQGGERFAQALAELSEGASAARAVKVGFLSGATYPDGTAVAQVAAWNEFGTVNQVPRPYFRRMIAAESKHWGDDLARALKGRGYRSDEALRLMGLQVKDELVSSIVAFTDPPLKPSTIAKKQFPKPLIDTGTMMRAADFEVSK